MVYEGQQLRAVLMNSSALSPLVIEIAVQAQSETDTQKLTDALQGMTAEDELFQAVVCPETGQAILKGTDEEQLDAKISHLRETSGIALRIGEPQVAYRETITRRVDIDYTHKRRLGQSGEFAKVEIAFQPNARGMGNLFEVTAQGETVPEMFLPSIESGIERALRRGLLASFPVTDTKAVLMNGFYHDTDTSPSAFETAAYAACREALQRGSPRLLEPFMQIEVTAPEAYSGNIKGDLVSRRGMVLNVSHSSSHVSITAEVPLANMFNYRNQLRSFTQGLGTFSMRFKDYRLVDKPDDPPPAASAAMRA